MTTGTRDPSNYRKMSEPIASSEEANKELQKFYELVYAARNECHIMDVHIVAKVNIAMDGGEHCAFSSAHFGNELEGAPMCAWGLGKEQERYTALLDIYAKDARQ